MNQKILIAIIVSVCLMGTGVFAWLQLGSRGEEDITNFEILELEEEFIERNQREVAFIRDGDIWAINKDLNKEYRIVDIDLNSALGIGDPEGMIIQFAISPDGTLFWLNNKGELWRQREGEQAILLSGILSRQKGEYYRKVSVEFCKESFHLYKELCEAETDIVRVRRGGVDFFKLSPDGEYIVYRSKAFRFGFTWPIYDWLWIMRSDGTNKSIIQRPNGVPWRDFLNYVSWLPDSRRIIFSMQEPMQGLSGTPFFEVGIDGKNPQVYTGISYDDNKTEFILNPDMRVDVWNAEPSFSPDGVKVINIGYQGRIWLANIDGSNRREILPDHSFWGHNPHVLHWSENGEFFSTRHDRQSFIFNNQGELLFATEQCDRPSQIIFSPDNTYAAGICFIGNDTAGANIVFLINLITGDKKDLQLAPAEPLDGLFIRPLFFSKEGRRVYYAVSFYVPSHDYLGRNVSRRTYQLWAVDLHTSRNYKITDDFNQHRLIRVP